MISSRHQKKTTNIIQHNTKYIAGSFKKKILLSFFFLSLNIIVIHFWLCLIYLICSFNNYSKEKYFVKYREIYSCTLVRLLYWLNFPPFHLEKMELFKISLYAATTICHFILSCVLNEFYCMQRKNYPQKWTCFLQSNGALWWYNE